MFFLIQITFIIQENHGKWYICDLCVCVCMYTGVWIHVGRDGVCVFMWVLVYLTNVSFSVIFFDNASYLNEKEQLKMYGISKFM